ncbi:glycolipid transfer protein domain-containing protein 2 isoform X2 [Elgaria multicarinata webbii]|uniref:glycolipid transfer protein domain-containing protein 2 isoform X2 n=1 Tax=Elgaria multicarinata webbii TaxID=159646 RepID=UPI002FCCC139
MLKRIQRADLPLSPCVWGGRPCRWFREKPPDKEDQEKLTPVPVPMETPAPCLLKAPGHQPQGNGFHIEHLLSAFTTSVTPDGQILIQEYLCGWAQLIKFMDTLGTVFSLINQETYAKITIMQLHQGGQHSPHYRTVQSMVAFELAEGLVGFQAFPPTKPPSGCRTLLRLHRALKWLELFLHNLGTSKRDGNPSRMCSDAYQVALAPYHSWWVQKAVAIAFLAMPSRQELYRIICPEDDEQKTRTVLQATVRSLARVHNITQDVYAAHGMLELP